MKFLKKIFMLMMPSFLINKMSTCKDLSTQISNNDQLSLIKKLDQAFHLLICEMCRNYKKQIDLINSNIHKISKQKDNSYRVKEIEQVVIQKYSKK